MPYPRAPATLVHVFIIVPSHERPRSFMFWVFRERVKTDLETFYCYDTTQNFTQLPHFMLKLQWNL